MTRAHRLPFVQRIGLDTDRSRVVVANHDWENPDWSLLDDRRGQLPEFPIDVLTPAWRDLLLRVSYGAGVRPEHVVVPLLGVASSLIGTARRVSATSSWSEPMTLWTCLVGESGERKSPGLNVTIRAIDLIERKSKAAINAKRVAHHARVQRAKAVAKKWRAECKAALDASASKEPPPMPAEAIDPGNFIEPRLYATDPTIERLARLLVARPRGLVLIRHELAGLFANMSRYSGGSDRPFWLEAYDGGRYVVERVMDSCAVEYLLVGVVGSFQPDKLARAFAGDDDSMCARFLYAWPLVPAYRPLTNEAVEVEPELAHALTALIQLPAEDVDGVFASQLVGLSDGASAKFEEFRELNDKNKRGLEGNERHWFTKGETVVLRLAGTLAFLEWAIGLRSRSSGGVDAISKSMEPEKIDECFMGAAIKLWLEFFWPHARAALRQIGRSDRYTDARRVLRWIKSQGKAEVSREEIRREALGQRLEADPVQAILDGLEKAGWLKFEKRKTTGRPIYRWRVNPVLLRNACG